MEENHKERMEINPEGKPEKNLGDEGVNPEESTGESHTTNSISPEEMNCDRILALMAIYRNEWIHRDSNLTSTSWKYALTCLVVTFFPNIIGSPDLSKIPFLKQFSPLFFSVAGIICSLIAMYLVFASGKRIVRLDDVYTDMMNKFPDGYRVKPLKSDPKLRNKFFSARLNTIFSILVFSVIIALALANTFWIIMA